MNYLNPADTKAINKLTSSLVKSYTSLREKSHVWLVALVENALGKDEFSYMTSQFVRLPENANKRGMLTWIKEYTNLSLEKNKEGKPLFKVKKGETLTFRQEEGRANPFYSMPKVIAENMPFDFFEGIEKLIDRGLKAIKEGKDMSAESKAAIVWYSRNRYKKAEAEAAPEAAPVAIPAAKPEAVRAA